MEKKQTLTQKQQYLLHLLPKLDDTLVDRMLAVAKPKAPTPLRKEADAYGELMAMVGCRSAKGQLQAMIADFRMRKLAEARGRPSKRAYYHAVFSGNPGCAKTTCARLYAKILAKEGITKKDHFVELCRSSIVGQYVGSTAQKVRDIFQKYAGGLLFVDEAYSLCDGGPGSNNDYGEEAINEMILCLENYPETVVIFAGYPDKMAEFLDSNPGLSSRIPFRVEFDDYSAQELVAISQVIAGEQGYEISPEAKEKLFAIYEAARAEKNFGNGRYARNLVEAAVRSKGIHLGIMENWNPERFLDSSVYPDEAIFSLDESCFAAVSPPPQEIRRKIGFCF